MASKSSVVHQAVAEIRAKAKELRSYGAEGPALGLEQAATRFEAALL